jgi:hypothetical protein
MRSRLVVPALLLAACFAGSAADVAAQRVRGTVIDRETQRPIPAAALTLLRNGNAITTVASDDAGRFILRLPRPGSYTLQVSHIGYRGGATPLPAADPTEEISITVALSVEALELDPVRVTGRRPAGARLLDGFYDRAAVRRPRNDGRFFMREDMARMSVSQVTDYLALVPSLQLQQSPVGRERMPVLRIRGALCVPKVYLNGGRIAAYDIDTFVLPGTLEGIEVYAQGDEPAEYWDRDSCGVILMWTPLRTQGLEMDRRRFYTLLGIVTGAVLVRVLTF